MEWDFGQFFANFYNYLVSLVVSAGLSLAVLFALFTPMERAFPAQPFQPIFRAQWGLDLCFFLGQYLLWGGLVSYALNLAAPMLSTILLISWQTNVKALPTWLQAVIAVLISDFLVYWAHRLQHRIEFLWRFHRVHHSSEHLDWLAAHREHPLDTIYTVGLLNLPAIMLGFSLDFILALVSFRAIWAIYIHSNVRLPLRPVRWLIGAPELHHWHHDKDRDAGNYANLSPLMDILFGTYTCPDHEPERLGLHDPSPKTYIGHMLQPILPSSWWQPLRDRGW